MGSREYGNVCCIAAVWVKSSITMIYEVHWVTDSWVKAIPLYFRVTCHRCGLSMYVIDVHLIS